MDMTKDAAEFISNQAVTAAQKRIEDHGDTTFLIQGDGSVEEFMPNHGASEPLQVHTLTAIADYILSTSERKRFELLVEVKDPSHVIVYGVLDKFGNRERLIEAEALLPRQDFGDWLDQESFIIAMQAKFKDTENSRLLMKTVGNLKEEDARTSVDDGVSQVATARTGVASVDDVMLPNPIELAPYRTFVEVEQPVSSFVFRLHQGMRVALFEGDGGQWRNEAITNIAKWLLENLKITGERVIVLA